MYIRWRRKLIRTIRRWRLPLILKIANTPTMSVAGVGPENVFQAMPFRLPRRIEPVLEGNSVIGVLRASKMLVLIQAMFSEPLRANFAQAKARPTAEY
jgi:hypothetical protein